MGELRQIETSWGKLEQVGKLGQFGRSLSQAGPSWGELWLVVDSWGELGQGEASWAKLGCSQLGQVGAS